MTDPQNGPNGTFCGVPSGAMTDPQPPHPGLVLNQQRRTASSGGLLMNIGYLEENGGVTSTSEGGDEMTALPRPASAGAAAIPTRAQEETVLYDYPPAASCQKTPPPGTA